MKKLLPSILIAIFVLLLPLHTYASTFDEVRDIIELNYVGEINGDLNHATSIEEMIDMLDPYSAYFTRDEYYSYVNSINQTTIGIGVMIDKHEKGILILDVFQNGSAKNAGIEVGDIITAINGQSTELMTIEQASSLITGEEGTSVSLNLLKTNGSTITISVTRMPFIIDSVFSKLLYGNVGYIQFNTFSSTGVSEVKEAYQSLISKGATSFIIDLQNNGGGYVSTAEGLIGLFPGAVNAYKLRITEGVYTIAATSQSIQFPKNTRVLVNRFSASASEMTAASLVDQNAAILYGEKTFGKGTMQSFYQLSDGSILKLTVGEFFGPKGTIVNKTGIIPHYQTKSNPIYDAHYDSIIEKLKHYEKLNSLLEVPTTKQFSVNFNKKMILPEQADAIELVKLGAEKIETKLSLSSDEKHITVSPKTPLQPGAEYMLIIHPTIQDKVGKKMKDGYYLRITVDSNE
ncbi:S41 family peptidase [Ureibacillus sp. MALMAid1270]|uniref:S41 family peptidase n=1 Tax=Ureibacillus sp. MALMAid1270 TaxID=3411629 RepID=UPI003BA50DAD